MIWLLIAQAVALAVLLPICKAGKRSDEECPTGK
jgi:hypothetical protein